MTYLYLYLHHVYILKFFCCQTIQRRKFKNVQISAYIEKYQFYTLILMRGDLPSSFLAFSAPEISEGHPIIILSSYGLLGQPNLEDIL